MTTMTRMTTVNQKNLKNNKMGGTDVPPIKLKMNIVNYQKNALKREVAVVTKFAEMEGLDAHGPVGR